MKAIIIPARGSIHEKEVTKNGSPLYDFIKKSVGGWLENVHPMRLSDRYIMVVNEEGLLHGLKTNPLASYLYGMDQHGAPIVGDVVILKRGYYKGEPDVVGIPDDEIEDIKNELNDNISEMEKLDFYKKYVIPKRI